MQAMKFFQDYEKMKDVFEKLGAELLTLVSRMLLHHAIKLKFLTYLQKYTELHYSYQENDFIAKY